MFRRDRSVPRTDLFGYDGQGDVTGIHVRFIDIAQDCADDGAE